MGLFLQQGIDAAKTGKMEEALSFLKAAAEEEANNPDVWVWLSAIIDDEEKQSEFLRKALEIDPQNKPAQRGLAFLQRKKYIAPKPGETLSDYTRPIGVFKSAPAEPVVVTPEVQLVPLQDQQAQVPSLEEQADFDMDIEDTLPREPDLQEENLKEEIPEGTDSEPWSNSEDKDTNEDDSEPSKAMNNQEEGQTQFDGAAFEAASEATRVSAVFGKAKIDTVEDAENGDSEEALHKSSDVEQLLPAEELEDEAQIEGNEHSEGEEQSQDADDSVSEIKPETSDALNGKTSLSKDKKEPFFVSKLKTLKWEILIYGLILAVFIAVGVLAGATLLKLSEGTVPPPANLVSIKTQNGVFMAGDFDPLQLPLLNEFPTNTKGFVETSKDFPQIVFKDSNISDTKKLILLDANKNTIPTSIKILDAGFQYIQPNKALVPGSYCVSYAIDPANAKAFYWCFTKK